MTTATPAWQAALEAEHRPPSMRRIALASFVTIGIGFGGFFGWACTASLDSAVPANGSIVVASKRKTVSLLDPGTLKEILVRDGDKVTAGQPLLRLEDTQAQAQLGQLKANYWTAVAKNARLTTELADQRTLAFPADLVEAARNDAAIDAIAANEKRLFDARWETYDGTLAVQRKKIAQFNDQLAAVDAQKTSTETRLALTDDELNGVMKLLAKGYATKPRALDLQRQHADLLGTIGSLAGRRAEIEQQIGQAQLELISTTNTRKSDAAKDLQDAKSAMADLAERMRGAADLVAHKEVVAPESGTVTDIKFFTPGSSIAQNQPILDIVPASDKMIVEVAVRPEDIEHVHVGLKANVRLTSYKQHRVPVLPGRITYVSADRQSDPKNGEPFFMARAELDPGALSKLDNVKLYPGMPTEVLIIGGERLAIDYFISPITDGFSRALREE